MSVRSVVIFERGGHHAVIERSILRVAGVAKQSVVSSEQALFEELQEERDLVLINWSDKWDELTAMVKALRHKDTAPDPFIPIVIVSAALSAANASAALNAGVNSLVRVPFSATDINRQLALAAKPMRFIDAPNYFGPDRRSGEGDVTPEMEARFGAPCRIIEGDILEAIRATRRPPARSGLGVKSSILS